MAKSKHNLGLKEAIIEAIKQKKGHDIVAIDLTDNHQAVADYYIICHGNSSSQVEAITDNIERFARTETSEHPSHIEGQQNALWVLMDYGNIIVHIFQEEIRSFYNIEDLWADAKKEIIETEE
ncbi:MAG: ribosome silencing factor [Salinivirgaceae bacterium]|nr:ribosome silencing factor [Salinivirgaceae bacterium]MBO7432506.1 ribosome silencing factor [Salinivirgaceae bacterium]MBO7594956.1 ribosome silencing factor [Salinivirgaceae bacterium]MBR5166776.1 ribosome silencing factor [Salinivirgaceae bacterium]